MTINKEALGKYLIEFVVVFLSVSLSFLVEEYRDNAKDRTKANALLIKIKNELELKATQTAKYIDEIRVAKNRNKIIYDDFLLRKLSTDSLITLMFYADITSVFNPNMYTWESIVSAGSIDLFDQQLIDSINILRKNYESIASQNNYVNRITDNRWGDVLKTIDSKSWAIAAHNYFHPNKLKFEKKWDSTEFFRTSVAFDVYATRHFIYGQLIRLYEDEHQAAEKRIIKLVEEMIKD